MMFLRSHIVGGLPQVLIDELLVVLERRQFFEP